MKWSFGAAVGVAAVMAFAGPARAAVDAFLQLDGVKGESQDANHKDQIELTSWSMGASGGGMGAASSGRAAGRANVSEIQITKAHDTASPLLMQAAVTGRHFKNATLYVRKAGAAQPYLEYKLSDVIVSGYQTSSGGDRPTESMSLNFTKIEMLDHPQTADTAVTRTGMVPSASRLPPPGRPN
jgi:type VI secretion system secreted protein Hcp